jgi:3-hydroxybutyryl-CoA dehydrogenase
LDHARLIGVDMAGDTSKRVTLMTTPGADPDVIAGVAAIFKQSGRNVCRIADSSGFVGPRMIAMIANLGCYMAEIGLASPEDIDTAMQLGLNYPRGSIAMAEAFGAWETRLVLDNLHEATGDDRYRPTAWLRRRSDLDISLYTPN